LGGAKPQSMQAGAAMEVSYYNLSAWYAHRADRAQSLFARWLYGGMANICQWIAIRRDPFR